MTFKTTPPFLENATFVVRSVTDQTFFKFVIMVILDMTIQIVTKIPPHTKTVGHIKINKEMGEKGP